MSERKRLVRGVEVDAESRCAHWRSAVDVVAMRFRCCGEYYGCHICHEAVAGHAAQRWETVRDADEMVAMCGVCGGEFTLAAYLTTSDRCPACGTGWNPGCVKHRDLYFE